MTEDKRHFHRILCNGSVRLHGHGYEGETALLDLSLKGALVQEPGDWRGAAGDDYELEILLENADTPLRMRTLVAHREHGHVGFRCHHIDIDSISFLRRLVELNLGDPALLERELSALG